MLTDQADDELSRAREELRQARAQLTEAQRDRDRWRALFWEAAAKIPDKEDAEEDPETEAA